MSLRQIKFPNLDHIFRTCLKTSSYYNFEWFIKFLSLTSSLYENCLIQISMMSRISKIQNHLQNTQTYINIYLLSPLSGLLKSAAYFSQISISIFPWWGLVSRRLGYFLCRAHQGWKIYDTKRGQINLALLCKMKFSGKFYNF